MDRPNYVAEEYDADEAHFANSMVTAARGAKWLTVQETGHIESLDRHVTPRSLYLTQLRDRLGERAVRHVALSSQEQP